MNKKKCRRKVLLLSLDALSITEFDRLKNMKSFKTFMENGTYSKNLISVYPTQTYTVHTTVATGCYPDKHGIFNNKPFQPFVNKKDEEWYWYRKQIKTNTIYDLARQNGLKTCSLLWPVTGKAKTHYNLPEILALKNENQKLKVMINGTISFILKCELKHGKNRVSNQQPHLDEYIKRCTIDVIKSKAPDLVMVHLVSVDAAKHKYGVESEEITKTVQNLDRIIGEIIDECPDDYTIIMFSDHGQFTIKKDVHINNVFRDAGLIDAKKNEFMAYVQSMGGSGVLRTKDKQSQEKALKLLKDNKEVLGIESIYGRETLDKMHVSKDFEYVIEGKIGFNFCEELSENLIVNLKEVGRIYATHGYNPEKDNYECLFFAKGKDICIDKEIGRIEMVDIAPTIANILNINMYSCDGKVIENIFMK